MTRMTMMVLALGFAVGACKKDEKKPETPAAAADAAAAKADTPTTPPAATPPIGDGLTIAFVAPKVGDKQVDEQKMTNDIVITAQGQEMKMQNTEEEKKASEVLEVSGDVVTKVKVTYETAKEAANMGGKTQEKKGVVPGKAYVVWIEGTEIKATDDKGGAVAPAELDALKDDWKRDIGKVPGMAKVITSRPWKLGEKVELTPEQIADLNMGDEETTATATTVVLSASDGKVATFDLDVALDQKVPGGVLKAPMHVTVAIDIPKSRPTTMTMKGTIEGDVQGAHAKGTLTGSETTTYP